MVARAASSPEQRGRPHQQLGSICSGLLAPNSLKQMTGPQFQDLCLHVHAVRDHARQVASTTLGLEQGMTHMSKEERTKVFAKYRFSQRSQDGSTCCDVIDFVLHAGSKPEIPDRIFAACYEDAKKVPHLGVSALGEMVGWALPDDFPPRNGRTSKALTALGFPVAIHSE